MIKYIFALDEMPSGKTCIHFISTEKTADKALETFSKFVAQGTDFNYYRVKDLSKILKFKHK